MKLTNTENQFAVIAATFCLIGLAMLLSIIIWHRQINQHPWFQKGVTIAAPELQVASAPVPVTSPSAPVVVPSTASLSVPESVIREITSDPRNLANYVGPTEEMSPAIKFLYTLESPDIFPNQR